MEDVRAEPLVLEPIDSPRVSKFHRLLPPGGVPLPAYRLVLIDVNDVPEWMRLRSKLYLRNSPAYGPMLKEMQHIKRGDIINRRFCIYAYTQGKKGEPEKVVGRAILTEFLDNPYGYGIGDFSYTKLVFPKFHKTMQSRYLTSTVLYLAFESGLAKNVYAYLRANPKATGSFFLERIDRNQPCVPVIHPTDGPDVQKYVKIKAEVQIPPDKTMYLLVEYNGDLYRSMDKQEYLLRSLGAQDRENVQQALLDLSLTARQVGRYYASLTNQYLLNR